MQEYPIKRTHIKAFPENITKKLEEHFEQTPEVVSEGHYRIVYGALNKLDVIMGEKQKSMLIETESKSGIEDEEVILDTNRRFRRYLDDVTGYSTKERVKKAKKVE